MPFQMTVVFDVTEAVRVLQALSAPRLQRATMAALNDTAKNAQVQSVKEIAPKLGLPSREVKKVLTISTATTAHLEAALVAQGRPIPLIRFKPKDTKRTGVTARIAGKTTTYRHAFIATMKSGHKAVWERVGTARGPVKELYGPSIPGIASREDVKGVVARTISEQLNKNIARQMERQTRAARGLAGTKSVG